MSALRMLLALVPAVCALSISAGPSEGRQPLVRVQTIELPGVRGRIDHLAVDLKRHRLFVAALGNDSVEVIDLGGRAVHSIRGLQEPQGIAFIPEHHRLFVASGGDGRAAVFDSASFALIQEVKGLDDADNLHYHQPAGEVYVGYGRGGLRVLDAATGRALGDIPLSGHPEGFMLERSGSRGFVNVPSAGQIAVVDRVKRAVIAAWPLHGTADNFPLDIDEAGHRLFVAVRRPPQLLVYDTMSGRLLSSTAIKLALPLSRMTWTMSFMMRRAGRSTPLAARALSAY